MQPMTRRAFVGLGTAGAGATGLAALGWDLTGAVRVQQDLRIAGAKEVRSLCPYCAVGCAIVAYTRPGAGAHPELLQIEGDPDSPVNEGRLCPNGPLPEHYEPIESPIENPLHPQQSVSPVAFLYDERAGRENRFGTAKDYPYVATSYRLTEHEHFVTQHVPLLVGLQPQPFVEIPEELAREKGIRNGDRVRVSSKRGHIDVAALVTRRLGPVQVAGKTVYQIGIPIHWGFVGIAAERDPQHGAQWLANALTPLVGDANSRTPEFRAFLVDVQKV